MKTLKSTITLAATIIIGLALYSQPSYAEEFIISLKQGENLISIPLQPQDTKIEAVISSIAGNYTDVWTHNAGDAIDPWKHYNPDYTGYNDLKTIEHGKGYRLFTNKDCVLKVTGTTPSAQTYPLTLHQGWNLIGWPFVYSQTIPEALKGLQFGIDYDQVSRINPISKDQEDYYNAPTTNDFNTFEPGRAYYIYCKLKEVTVILTSPTDQYPIYSDRSATTSYWVDASSYSSLTDAIAAIGPQEKTLLIPKALDISKSITIPENINLHFEKGGKLTIPTAVTVTINGGVDAGLFQIFECQGTGKVAFGQGAVKEVYPQWWGAKGNGKTDDTSAIQAAIVAGSVIYFPEGTYLAGEIDLTSLTGYTLIGAGPEKTIIKSKVGTLNSIHIRYGKSITVENLSINLTLAGGTPNGIYWNEVWKSTIRNVWIYNVPAGGNAIYLDSTVAFGAQHNYLCQVNTPDAPIKILGASLTNAAVTTTVLEVCRGLSYSIRYAGSITMIDTTAEAFTDIGIDLDDCSQVTLVGVDIEGDGPTAIAINNVTSFIGVGVNLAGFTGRNRLLGAPSMGFLQTTLMADATFWGNMGSLSALKAISYNASADQYVEIGTSTDKAVDETKPYKYRWIVEGNASGQLLKLRRYLAGNTTSDVMTIDSSGNIGFGTLPAYANNDAAVAGGLKAGAFYRNGDVVCIVHE